MRTPNQPSEEIQYHQEDASFFDDELNRWIVAALVLVSIILIIKYNPWQILIPVATATNTIATSTTSAAASSAASTGLSVAEMVNML